MSTAIQESPAVYVSHGIDVTTTVDAGLIHATDEEQLAYSTSEGRVLFTQDADFLRLDAAGLIHAGIAFCPTRGAGPSARSSVR